MSMFCYQCEQASKRTGCSSVSVCGKDEPTANLQDLLVHVAEGVAMYAHRARKLGARDAELDRFVVEALFTTVTNVNFDAARVAELVRTGATLRDRARGLYEDACAKAGRKPETLGGPAAWHPGGGRRRARAAGGGDRHPGAPGRARRRPRRARVPVPLRAQGHGRLHGPRARPRPRRRGRAGVLPRGASTS